jgi:hypothetical protein
LRSKYIGNASGKTLGVVDVQKLVRPMRVGVRPEDASAKELRLRELDAEHRMKGMVPSSPTHIAGVWNAPARPGPAALRKFISC